MIRCYLMIFLAWVPFALGERHIAVSRTSSCAITEAGNIVCAGSVTTPDATTCVGKFHAVSVADAFACALSFDGLVSCWGAVPGSARAPASNVCMSMAATGYPIVNASNDTATARLDGLDLSAGFNHVCVMRHNGAVVCIAEAGHLVTQSCDSNNNSMHNRECFEPFQSITCAGDMICGVKRDFSVGCWGDVALHLQPNNSEMLLLSQPSQTLYPLHITLGVRHACVIVTDGTAYCWGDNSYGQTTAPSTPLDWVSGGGNTTCGIAADTGRLLCWGRMDSMSQGYALVPFAEEVACSEFHCCAITLNERATPCWATVTPSAASTSVNHMMGLSVRAEVYTGGEGFQDGDHSIALFDEPYGITSDPRGNIYVADGGNNMIRKISPDGNVSTLAGNKDEGLVDGVGSDARLNYPHGIVFDGTDDSIYIADFFNRRVRRLSSNGIVTTVANTVGYPCGVALHSSAQMLYVSETGQRIRAVSLRTGVVSTIAGSYGSSDGVGTSAGFSSPCGLALQGNDTLYVADSGNNKIRKVNVTSTVVTTFAGSGIAGMLDGIGTNARFYNPYTVTLLRDLLYVSDHRNLCIRVINGQGFVSTLQSTSGGALHLPGPVGLTALVTGQFAVIDVSEHAVYKLTRHITSTSASICSVPLTSRSYGAEDALTSFRMQALSVDCQLQHAINISAEFMDDPLNPNNTIGISPRIHKLEFCGEAAVRISPAEGLFSNKVLQTPSTLLLKMQEIPAHAFASPSVTQLFVRGNGSLRIHEQAFAGLPALQCINCADFSLRIANFSNLGIFTDIEGNLDMETLQYLANMRGIHLHNNGIRSMLAPSRNWTLPNLSSLLICDGTSNSGASALFSQPGSFAAFPSLSYFSALDREGGELGILSALDLRGCGISNIHPQAFPRIPPGIKLVDLSHNNISLISAIKESIGALFAEGAEVSLVLASNKFFQINEYDFDNMYGLASLDLSHNSITFLHQNAFSSIRHPALQHIDLRFNPLSSQPCPPGYYNNIQVLLAGGRAVACFTCPPGMYCPGNSTAVSCAAGRYSDSVGAESVDSCQACPVGTTNGLTGQTRLGCVMCPSGTHSDVEAANSSAMCKPCGPGTYAAGPGNGACTRCVAGSFSSQIAAVSSLTCVACSVGTFSGVEGATSNETCTACPEGTTTTSAGSTAVTACVQIPCSVGEGRNVEGRCVACGAGEFSLNERCESCSSGRFSSANTGAGVCSLCPVGTYFSGTGATSAAQCRSCTLGTVCNAARTGCIALCPPNTLLDTSQSEMIALLESTCTTPDILQQALLCHVCNASSLQACIAGSALQIPLLSRILEPASSHSPYELGIHASGASYGVVDGVGEGVVSQSFDSCGQYVEATYATEPTANYVAVRLPIIIASASVAVCIVLVCVLLNPADRFTRLAVVLKKLDLYSSSHAVPQGSVLRNSSTTSGGAFTLGFVTLAVGLTISVLIQFGMRRYEIALSVVDTPPLRSESAATSVHFGSLNIHMLLIGPQSGDKCALGAIQPSGDAGNYVVHAVQQVSMSDVVVAAQFRSLFHTLTTTHSTFASSGLTGCYVHAVCDNCQLTSSSAFHLQADISFQNVAINITTRSAIDTCAPVFEVAYSAPSPDQMMQTLQLEVEVRPVILSYLGVISSGKLADTTGHDLSLRSSTVTLHNQSILHPGVDTIDVRLHFNPAPYSSKIVVHDAFDTLTVVTGLLGMLSGLAGACLTFNRQFDKLKMRRQARLFSKPQQFFEDAHTPQSPQSAAVIPGLRYAATSRQSVARLDTANPLKASSSVPRPSYAAARAVAQQHVRSTTASNRSVKVLLPDYDGHL